MTAQGVRSNEPHLQASGLRGVVRSGDGEPTIGDLYLHSTKELSALDLRTGATAGVTAQSLQHDRAEAAIDLTHPGMHTSDSSLQSSLERRSPYDCDGDLHGLEA